MGGSIDAAREAGDHDDASIGEARCECPGHGLAGRGAAPRADDCNSRANQQFEPTLGVNQGRWLVEPGQLLRIARLDREQRLGSELLGGLEFAFGRLS